jgi:general stress protein YciG
MKNNELSQAASILGKKGGRTTLERYGKKFMSEIGRKGAISRKNKKVNN